MAKKYAMIKDYGKLAVPVSLLEKIAEHSYLVETTWEDNGEVLSSAKRINDVRIIDQKDIDTVLAQMALEGNND